MHILLFGYYYGRGAEGVCTQRLCDALMDDGKRISLVTSNRADIRDDNRFQQAVKLSSFPFRPQRHLQGLNYLLTGCDCEFPAWGWRAAMVKPATDVDVIYARTRPLTSAFPAMIAAKRSGLPLVLHFSDPAPSPWLDPRSTQGSRERSFSVKLAQCAAAATFTTTEAMELQACMVPQWANVPSYVVPHIAPRWESNHTPVSGTRLLYTGSFYGARGPHSLLKGFGAFQKTRTAARLTFLGSNGSLLSDVVRDYSLEASIDILPPVIDVTPVIKEATTLVAVDSFHSAPVFMSTKFVEYLATDKPIVLISPRQSPSAKLAQDERAGIYLVDTEEPAAIARAFERSASNPTLTSAQKSERARLIACFSANAVAEAAIKALASARRF